MSHRFDRSKHNVYGMAANEIDKRMFSGTAGVDAAAGGQLYDALSNAIVSALGDVAAQAFRNGVNSPQELKGLAQAIAHVSEDVIAAYRGEVDPEPVLRAIESDPRVGTLNDIDRDQLTREIDKTRRLEHLLLDARRLPDLVDLAGSLDIPIPDETLDEAPPLLSPHPTPTAGTT